MYFRIHKYCFFFKVNSPPGQNGSSTLATLSEDIEETFERKLYATNNSSHLNLHDMKLSLVTTAVDIRNQFYFFLRNPKQEVVRLLKLEVKSLGFRETGSSGKWSSSSNPHDAPKPQLPTNNVPKDFFVVLLHI